MHKRKSSGLKDVEHSGRKRFKSEDDFDDVNCDDASDQGEDDDNDDDDDDDVDDDDDNVNDSDAEDYDDGGENDDNDDEEEDENKIKNQRNSSNSDFTYKSETEVKKPLVRKGENDFAFRYMKNFGYERGKGLGKRENGIIEPLEESKQKGTRGLGYQNVSIEKIKYDPEEDKIFDEEIDWLINKHPETVNTECLKSWVKCGPPITTLTEDSPFCEPHIIRDIIYSKCLLDNFNEKEKINGRRRSNPYESIQNAIFLNRAAMKMANMDAILGWMFTEPKTKTGEPAVNSNELLYFADVCAGPGGFSEYVLYRKRWRAKGFGFTLRSENDFKLDQFIAGPPETFKPHYGELKDGDVFVPENITSFRDYVMKYTDNLGVHFMMADGGIHIENNLCEQEIITKKLYLCQCIVALLIVRTGGHFVVKLFDLFTAFSVGLVYLMYRSFEEILILKPKTSRPANSERYLICKWKRKDCDMIAEHLFEINPKISKFGETHEQDVLELVPTEVLEDDEEFFNYIKSSNIKLAERQVKNLQKMAYFSEKKEEVDTRQQMLRKECLEKWNIPDKARAEPKNPGPRAVWMELIGSPPPCKSDYWSEENKVTSKESFKQSLNWAKYSWNAVLLSLGESDSTFGFYLGLGKNNIHKYFKGKWVKENDVDFCLPANSVVLGEKVQEFLGKDRSQRKISAFHIIDGLFLGGEDIRHQSFQKRGEMCALFSKALFKEEYPVRVKNRYLLGNIHHLWDHLVLKRTKSSQLEYPAIELDEDRFYKALGVMFLKDLREPWERFWSNSSRAFYLSDKGRKNYFEKDIKEKDPCIYYADFEKCFDSRLVWWWDDGVVVHNGQKFPTDPNKVQRKDVMSLLDEIQKELDQRKRKNFT